MYHDSKCQSDHSEAFLFEDEAKQFGDILDWEVIDEEANKPLKYPHLVRYTNPFDLFSKILAFYSQQLPKEVAVESCQWEHVLINTEEHKFRLDQNVHK